MEITDIIKQSIDATYNKHYVGTTITPQYFTEQALMNIMNNNNYSGFTSSENARSNMMAIGRNALMIELIKGAYTSYAIATSRGYAREISTVGKNGYPETIDQAVNYIYDELTTQGSPSIVYAKLQNGSSQLTDLLVSNYAHLVNTYTKEERMEADSVYAPYLQDKLNTLDNLRVSLMVDPNVLENTARLGY